MYLMEPLWFCDDLLPRELPFRCDGAFGGVSHATGERKSQQWLRFPGTMVHSRNFEQYLLEQEDRSIAAVNGRQGG